MTIQKLNHFQEDLRKLFLKYDIQSGCALFMHDEMLHPVECHGTEKNEYIVALMNGLVEALMKSSDVPVHETWNTDQN